MRPKLALVHSNKPARPSESEGLRRPIDIAILRDDPALKQEFGPENAIFAECLGMPLMVLSQMLLGRKGLCLLVREPQLSLEGIQEGAWLSVDFFQPSQYQNILWNRIEIPKAAEVAKRFIRPYVRTIQEQELRTARRVAIFARARQGNLSRRGEQLLTERAAWLKKNDAAANRCQAINGQVVCDATLSRDHFLVHGAWVQSCQKHLFLDESYREVAQKEPEPSGKTPEGLLGT